MQGFSMNILSPRYINHYHEKGARGMVFMMDLNDTSVPPVPLTITEDEDFKLSSFRPHGISVWHEDHTGKKYCNLNLTLIT